MVLSPRIRQWFLALLGLAWVVLPAPWGYAQVSVNLALDDPAYALLEKLVRSQLTFTNALTIKPISRLYAARLIAEAFEQRQRGLESGEAQVAFLDATLEYLTSRFKRELQQIGFFYRPRRPGPVVVAPLVEVKIDTVFAQDPLVHRDSSGLTPNLQGVFGLQEGFAPGKNLSWRTRAVSWATLGEYGAAYVEPEILLRSDPLFGDRLEVGVHKGYVKGGYANLELAFGRDTLWWGPASQGDLVLSNNAPPLDLVQLRTPTPFRLPWAYGDAGEWQVAYFAARLEADREFSHAMVSGVRVAFQPARYVKLGYTNALMAYGHGGVHLSVAEYLQKLFVPTFDTTGRTANGLVAYDAVLSLPLGRLVPFVEGLQLYWQRGQDNVQQTQGVLGGGNIVGGVLEGGRWDVRVEFVETRDVGPPWYTHPTYSSGFAFQQFVLGHPIGGAAEGLYGRAQYYLSPTFWMAADGRHEQYEVGNQAGEVTQRRYGLEASYQVPWKQRFVTLWGRFDYTTFDEPAETTRVFNLRLLTRWHF